MNTIFILIHSLNLKNENDKLKSYSEYSKNVRSKCRNCYKNRKRRKTRYYKLTRNKYCNCKKCKRNF